MDNGLLNKGGTILFDNALFYGQVYSEERSKEKTPNGCGVRECEDFIREDLRVQRVNTPMKYMYTYMYMHIHVHVDVSEVIKIENFQ